MARTKSAIYRRRFHEVFTKYIADNKVKVDSLPALVNRSRATIFKWRSGSQAPGRKELQRICNIFGWPYHKFFIEEVTLDQIFSSEFLSFDSLNQRYIHLAERSAHQALGVLGIAAVMIHATLNIRAVRAILTVSITDEPSITFEGMTWLKLKFEARPHTGIRVKLEDRDNPFNAVWRSLTKENVVQLTEDVYRVRYGNQQQQ